MGIGYVLGSSSREVRNGVDELTSECEVNFGEYVGLGALPFQVPASFHRKSLMEDREPMGDVS